VSARRYSVELSAQEIAGLYDVLLNSDLSRGDPPNWYRDLRYKFQVLYQHTQDLEPK